MKFAILGTRGIPARYGGFETFAEELARRLTARGHQVAVYCRQRHSAAMHQGASLIYLPAPRHKYLETIVHTAISTLHLLFHPADAALYCNAANAIFTWLPRVIGVPTALNVDGLERKRRKWNRLAQGWYLVSERLATICPNEVISDARAIADYYRTRYGKQTHFIPYGASTEEATGSSALAKIGLQPGRYFLYVSRMEPENNALLVREAFESVTTDLKLALVGDAPYAPEYIAHVRRTSDARVIIPGAIYGPDYHELQAHSFAYVHATEVGGTHPALIEAMGRGALVLYLDTPENREVAGDAGIPFTHATLGSAIRSALQMSESERRDLRNQARERVRREYSWETVTDAYERLLVAMTSR